MGIRERCGTPSQQTRLTPWTCLAGIEPHGNTVLKPAHFTVETIEAGLGEVLVYIEDPEGHTEEVPALSKTCLLANEVKSLDPIQWDSSFAGGLPAKLWITALGPESFHLPRLHFPYFSLSSRPK